MWRASSRDDDDDDVPPAKNGTHPQITAKGLGRTPSTKPLVYSSPSLDSDTPEVRVGAAGDDATAAPRKAAPRPNPNRGSRGNRGGSTSNQRRRKR